MKKYILSLLLLTLIIQHPLLAQKIQVMSYNIHHGANKQEVNTLAEIGQFIKDSGAELVGLQEVDSMCNRSGKVDQMEKLGEITGMHYAFVRHFAYEGGAYGLGILSKYPISDVRNDRITSLSKGEEKKSLALLSAKVMLPGKKAIVFSTVHFALDQPTRITQSLETIEYLKRGLPAILTGDLNVEPGQKELLQLEAHYTNIGLDKVDMLTFPDEKATKRIDYILVTKESLNKVIKSWVRTDIHHSDHLPLMAEIVLKKR